MPKHIKRLTLLFAVLVVLFLVARHFLIPESFGQFGHYRGLALDEINANDVKYLGEAVCADCHADVMDMKLADKHAGISCETCHGPGWKHVDDPGPDQMILPEGRKFCGTCHSKNPARPKDLVAQIDLADHNAELMCTDCHNNHAPWN